MSQQSAPPPWLVDALKSSAHFENTLTVLNRREADRDDARAVSRRNARATRKGIRSIIPSSNNSLFVSNKQSDFYAITVGASKDNQDRNRYAYLEPYDRTRVIVGGEVGHSKHRGYLHANWVRELWGGKWWIATQAPLPNTAHTFLNLMLQSSTTPPAHLNPSKSEFSGSCRIRTIVQLTKDTEGGRPKAHSYFLHEIGEAHLVWPEDDCDLPPVEITLLDRQANTDAQCVISTLRLAPTTEGMKGDQDKSVVFRHLLYTAWPDFGVPDPEDQHSLLVFARLVAELNLDKSLQPKDAHPDPPIIVGCSAGIGRTGTFITLCSILRTYGLLLPGVAPVSQESLVALPQSPLRPLPSEVLNDKIAAEIDSLREQRTGLVQKPEQMLLIYQVLYTAFAALTQVGETSS